MMEFETKSLKDWDCVIGVDEAGRGPLAGPVVTCAFTFMASSTAKRSSWMSLFPWNSIADSKAITESSRTEIFKSMLAHENADKENLVSSLGSSPQVDTKHPQFVYAKASIEAPDIDRLNILQATMLGMARSVLQCIINHQSTRKRPSTYKVYVDGTMVPPLIMQLQNRGVPEKCPPILGEEIACQWPIIIQYVTKISAESVIKGDSKVYSISAASIVAKVSRDKIMEELGKEYPKFDLAQNKGYPTPSHKSLVKDLGPSKIHRFSFEPCKTLLLSGKFSVPEGRSKDELERLRAQETEKFSKKKRPRENSEAAPSGNGTLFKYMKIK